jgi:hypothetical protein
LGVYTRGGIRGFSDLGGDDAEEEGQDFYTGGKASGMVVRDPKAPPSGSSHDIVSELMENARKYVAPHSVSTEQQRLV